MPDTERIKFSRTAGTVTIKSGDTVFAESADAVVLSEDGYPPRHYFPPNDVNMSVLHTSDKTSRCPFKGEAAYFNADTPIGTLEDIAWTYAEPIDDAVEIAGLVAFYEETLKVIVN